MRERTIDMIIRRAIHITASVVLAGCIILILGLVGQIEAGDCKAFWVKLAVLVVLAILSTCEVTNYGD